MALVIDTKEKAQKNIEIDQEGLRKIDMEINIEKSKTVTCSMHDQVLSQIASYNYWGTIIEESAK